MTNFRKLSTAAAALTLGTFMSTGAFAMTCGEFNEMDSYDQLGAISEMGREGARDQAMGEDATEAGVATEQADGDDTMNDDAGREGARQDARGADVMMSEVMQRCMEDGELMVEDAMHPSEG
ncbi:hypothetical protein [Roseovarius sp. D0-M9]|uniref:hypothetical protein n=1 Tax=Roseovarius sp. D0-M9 TaxID=3127117 RepID=UPI00301030F2